MNWIKEARESIDWDHARLAANACIPVSDLVEMERHERVDPTSIAGLIRTILEQRGVTFTCDEAGQIVGVIGPFSDQALAQIVLNVDEATFLRELELDHTFGRRVMASNEGARCA